MVAKQRVIRRLTLADDHSGHRTLQPMRNIVPNLRRAGVDSNGGGLHGSKRPPIRWDCTSRRKSPRSIVERDR
jgi:hypothetical protein